MKTPQKFETIMDRLARRHGVQTIFSDFTSLLIYAFSLGKMEEQYLATIRKYEKPEAYAISEALAALVIEMTGPDGNGLVDVLGDYFEQHLSFGKNGQFFTPQHLCDLIARMINPVQQTDRIIDPACGSGRMLMAMAKVNRFARFYGADNDVNCAKMTVINLCLNGMFGEVAWMNSLTNDFYMAWEIYPTVKGCPCIREIPKQLSWIHLKLPEIIQKKSTIPEQQVLFEF